eukprot:1394291-Rhodomonas_salina.2
MALLPGFGQTARHVRPRPGTKAGIRNQSQTASLAVQRVPELWRIAFDCAVPEPVSSHSIASA